MRQRRVGGLVLLGAAALLLPAAAPAQMLRNFGGYRGGYYGYSPGVYSYGYAPGYYGYGYSPYAWGYAPGYTTYGSWSSPGYVWGNYNRGGYTSPGYATTDFYYNTPAMSSIGTAYPTDTGSYYSYGARAGAARDSALLNVRVPDPNAEVWVEGKLTRQRGTSREYESPPLNPDKSYTYEVRARWNENGRDVERTKTVPVRANGTATVDFTPVANNSRVDEIDKGKGAPEKGIKSSDKDRPEKP